MYDCVSQGCGPSISGLQFQGGAFDAWGPTAPGYSSCRELTGPDFESVFYRGLWASNAKLMNFYMIYGYAFRPLAVDIYTSFFPVVHRGAVFPFTVSIASL